MFVFSLVVVVYLPRLAARPQRRPTPRTLARGVFRMLNFFSHRLTTTAPARIHAQRAHRSHQAALGVPTAIATPTPLPRPGHVTAYPNDAHLRAPTSALPRPSSSPPPSTHSPDLGIAGPGTLPPRQTEHRDAGRPQHAPSWTAANDERRVPAQRSRVPRGRCTRAANDAPALDVPALALPALDDLRGRLPRACRPRTRRPRTRRSPRTPSPRLPSTRLPSTRSPSPR
ncbi:hypothetical protein PLICRDRAFT_180827 [Plicaturopsis crispa FD-325 SS-3]|uniref:Uncharacterized protein n=1 Tax=Plicaturopsis crispa FD-325 SS-3 TaxID=944288 RepID=A0A0C9T4F7_PLICR|nr:hypothetical protein PLICRDRAFT_180827 [Plicaturopsis crispa FD-325 SS-3]